MINFGVCYDNLRFGLISPVWQDNSHLPSLSDYGRARNSSLEIRKKANRVEK